jgi:2-hydroxychromene-2-carboxylate isomerase
MTNVDAYISLNSPWAFLGWRGLLILRERHKFTVTVKPARFGDVFAETGGLPLPKRAPARRAYRMMELKRWRDWHGVPVVLEPSTFPSDEAPGVRLVMAAQQQGLDAARLAAEIGHALWVGDQNIADASVLAAAAVRAGIDAPALLARAPSASEVDVAWTANTREAIERGVFGAPSYVLESGEIFWGQDRVPLLGWRLSGAATQPPV